MSDYRPLLLLAIIYVWAMVVVIYMAQFLYPIAALLALIAIGWHPHAVYTAIQYVAMATILLGTLSLCILAYASQRER